MTEYHEKLLSEQVSISKEYQRSIRIDTDLGREDAINSYVYNETAQNALENMANQLIKSQQRAFTWTGPYGSGKSSLALALASFLSPNENLRKKAKVALKIAEHSNINEAFHVEKGWNILPIVGNRGSVIDQIAAALGKTQHRSKKLAAAQLIKDLCSFSDENGFDGTLLILDEMGKFLEASALGYGDDIYFYQEVAEAAARAKGKVVIIGILHQSFSQYAARLSNETRNEWSKIQGRYVDIPLVTGSDEIVDLLSRALYTELRPQNINEVAKATAEAIRERRPMIGSKFQQSLALCWPLHPVMAALLGPISKRQFGQNERSIFSFLSSSEPYAFQYFLSTTKINNTAWYLPSNYFDYLQANLEQQILASSDGHRWAQAVDAVERTKAKSDSDLHITLIKCIAIIDLFKDGSGLTAESKIFDILFTETEKEKLVSALNDLSQWRVIIFKKYTGAWSIFEGSDFNIDQAVSKARSTISEPDFSLLNKIANLYPIIAKRHYHETGTFRWMNLSLCRLDDAKNIAKNFKPSSGEFGAFLIALPNENITQSSIKQICIDSSQLEPWPVITSIPKNHSRIIDLSTELSALQIVQNKQGHELQGDAVARREIQARIATTLSILEEQLSESIIEAKWYVQSTNLDLTGPLSSVVSRLAGSLYTKAPKLWSELVNRDNLSSTSVKARKELLYRMLSHHGQKNLGIDGYPAERGLFETTLNSTGLYRKGSSDKYCLLPPLDNNDDNSSSFNPLWANTLEIIQKNNGKVSATEIHNLWSKPPYGLKKGIMPIIFVAFLLAHKQNLALYKDNLFVPQITDVDIDEYLQNANRFSIRWVQIDNNKKKILSGVEQILASIGVKAKSVDPLEVARNLVAMVIKLPNWAQRTNLLSPSAKKVRNTLLKANDPHSLLFIDLPKVLGSEENENYLEKLKPLVEEIYNAYSKLLEKIASNMLKALDAKANNLNILQERAKRIENISGDLRLDAFINRLTEYNADNETLESILSLAANKPPRDWNDRDIDLALIEIANFAVRFRQSEALVAIKDRTPLSNAFAVVIGAGSEMNTFIHQFHIPKQHNQEINQITNELVSTLLTKGLDSEILMAILGKACMQVAKNTKEITHD